ncbi:hypothetical protein H5410_035733 [Solanum commersonii]|uniref:Uncharacterized protein n=1 Tax=Solanum commersonii TaxID=4109 RepID=A0A9J5Y2Q1_SOLCO|nr:hypothetical protein H5410_035733 [Solanum commersonii]
MLLQLTYHDKATQTETEEEDTIEKILKAITTLCTKVDSMDNEIQKLKTNEDSLKSKPSQQYDYKNAKLRRSKDEKNPELKGDDGKLLKTHNICLNTVAGTSKRVSEKQKNSNLNQLFEKPFTPRLTPKNILTIELQTSTYADNIYHEKRTYNHITQTYIENIYKIQTFFNLNPRSTTTQEPNQNFLTQKLQGYNKLIAQPKTNANLVRTCYNYGLLNTVYTYDGEELIGIPGLHKAFITYKRVTKGNLFYVKFYTATTEILYDEIKPPIQVVKIGLTKDMIISEDIGQQPEIRKSEILSFYANKRIIGISTIIQGLANNYLNGNAIWNYYARDQLMIYSNSRKLRKSNMDEVQRWILSLLKPEERPTTQALKEGFISAELLTRYCKLIGHKYPDHICSKCNGEDNIIQMSSWNN